VTKANGCRQKKSKKEVFARRTRSIAEKEPKEEGGFSSGRISS